MNRTLQLPGRITAAWRRAFSEFLTLPLAVVAIFIALAAVIYRADTAWSRGQVPSGFVLLGELLGDSKSLASLLSTIASSIITVTSITFSLLLIALQQGSSALTAQVTDQFLMRRTNQFYFGYFVGLSIFVLISLVTASEIHRPVFGTTIALVLTAGALCMIVVMIYNTIDQMRPQQIVRTIKRHTLTAREDQLALLQQSRREPHTEWPVLATLRAEQSGHIVQVDVSRLKDVLSAFGTVELHLLVPLGRYLAFGETVAAIRAPAPSNGGGTQLETLKSDVSSCIDFDDGRDLNKDAALGIEQLSNIGWTSVSTAKSNPSPAQAVIDSLRDILSRWAHEGEIVGDPDSPIVLADAAPDQAFDALENLIVAASESIQPQTLANALRTLAMLLPIVPASWASRCADMTRRALTSLGEHVLTRELERALGDLQSALFEVDRVEEARELDAALRTFASTIGTLNSRSTRVPAP